MQKILLGLVALALLAACSAGGASKAPSGITGNGGQNGGGGLNGSGGSIIGTGSVTFGGSTSVQADAACQQTVQQAEKRIGGRADIIFALDNSGSMIEENAAVQNNMNGFSTQITGSGIDAHVVMISAGPSSFDGACLTRILGGAAYGNGVCIDQPLGLAGACPCADDTNMPGYLHLFTPVDSHNALSQIQAQFPNYQNMLRADAAKTFVVVTDDEATPPDPNAFKTWVASQPVFQSAVWRFSGIFCVNSSSNCANVGTTYTALADATGGIKGDLSQFPSGNVDSQFKLVFDSLAAAIQQDAKPVDCAWAIPTPTDGKTIDFNTVNVNYTTATQTTPQSIYWVADQTACSDKFYGWYYDDQTHPTQVIACPQSCTVLQADLTTTVHVLYGCQREEPPIR